MSNPGQKALVIFLFVLGAVLVFFIFSQGYSISKSSEEVTNTNTKRNVDCIGYVYSITNIVNTEDRTTFDIQLESYADAESIDSITIVENSEQIDLDIIKGERGRVVTGLIEQDEFSVYVEDCTSYITQCSISESTCRAQI